MDSETRFNTTLLKELEFFDDNYKSFTISLNDLSWINERGPNSKKNITLTRFSKNTHSGEVKIAGRINFPVDVWNRFKSYICVLNEEIQKGI